MTRKQEKRCSTPFALREMQINTTMGHHFTPTQMGQMWNLTTLNVGKDAEELECSHHGLRGASTLENSLAVSHNMKSHAHLNTGSFYSYPSTQEKEKHGFTKNSCARIYIAALSIRAINWKSFRFPSTEERINSLLCVHTIEGSSALGDGLQINLRQDTVRWGKISTK